MATCPAIQFDKVEYGYTAQQKVLEQVSFSVPQGQFIGIAGCNGAGKSTMLRLMNVLLSPANGDVWLLGTNTKKLSAAQAALSIGTVFQNPNHQLFLETVEEEIAYGLKNRQMSESTCRERVDAALAAAELMPFRQSFPRTLSLGLRQRVALASVLALDCPILLLDEPTTGMDFHETQRFLKLIKEQQTQGKTIVMVTHDLELLLEHAERVLLLASGNIIADGVPQKVFEDVEKVTAAGLLPPDIVRLTYELNNYGIKTTANVDEAAEQVVQQIMQKGAGRLAG